MLAELETVPLRSDGASDAELEARGRVAQNLVIECSRHEAVEEQCIWPLVRDRVPGGGQLADHATGQEAERIHVLARLEMYRWPRYRGAVGRWQR